jgi:hypothetical protein
MLVFVCACASVCLSLCAPDTGSIWLLNILNSKTFIFQTVMPWLWVMAWKKKRVRFSRLARRCRLNHCASCFRVTSFSSVEYVVNKISVSQHILLFLALQSCPALLPPTLALCSARDCRRPLTFPGKHCQAQSLKNRPAAISQLEKGCLWLVHASVHILNVSSPGVHLHSFSFHCSLRF